MAKGKIKYLLVPLAVVIGTAICLSAFWRVAYIYTLIGFSALVVVGHLVTIDDDFPGGWSNPDGSQLFPWKELLIKIGVLLSLGLLAALFPGLRKFGV